MLTTKKNQTFLEWYIESLESQSHVMTTEAVNYNKLNVIYRNMASQGMRLSPDNAMNFMRIAFGVVQRSMRKADREKFEKLLQVF